jgi:solute carrier family 27 fatty acid transporter 1/4
MACRVANYFQREGYKKGDVVALVMENRVDYCCYWIGLSMIGVIPALVNSNLRQQSLLHTITVAKARAVIFSDELTPGTAHRQCRRPSVRTVSVDPAGVRPPA